MFTKEELEEIAKADAEIDAMDNAITPEIMAIQRELDKIARKQAGGKSKRTLTPEERAEHMREYKREYNKRPYVKEKINAYKRRPEVKDRVNAYQRERRRKKRLEAIR